MRAWPADAEALDVEQRRLAVLQPTLWTPPTGVLYIAACFLAFMRGHQGSGHASDRGCAGAVLMELPALRVLDRIALPVIAGAGYEPGRLARRAGPALEEAVTRLSSRADVVLVDATGRDHPRGAGLALQLGAVLDLPTVGVTHRPLIARGAWPPEQFGASTPLLVDRTVVGAWLRTRPRARPLAVHAAWRTDPATAVETVLRGVTSVRTPEPLRTARQLARSARTWM